MFEALAHIGGFGFFLFMLLVLVAGIISAEFDSIFGGVITLIGLAGGAQFLFGYPVWETVVANPFWIFVALVGYTVVGVLYAVFIKYTRFLKKYESHIKSEWDRFKKDFPDSTHEDFMESSRYREFKPKSNVDRITAWVVLWPWGVLWDLTHRPFTFIYNNVYGITGRMLDSVGKRITKNMLEK